MTTRSALKQPHNVDYSHLEPLPDPQREPDMQQHEHVIYAGYSLRGHFADRDDVLVSGAGYLRHEATNDAERLAPDCVVAFGVNPRAIVARNGYVISEVGKPPDFVLEVASRSTGRNDYTTKRVGYAGYGVHEYWRFDHTGGRFHDAALAGDVLVDGECVPVEIVHESDGLIWGRSDLLGLDLCWHEGELRLRDPSTGEFLPTPEERHVAQVEADAQAKRERTARSDAETRAERERAARLQADAQAKRERTARSDAETRAERERAARLQADARVADLEAELQRLRDQ